MRSRDLAESFGKDTANAVKGEEGIAPRAPHQVEFYRRVGQAIIESDGREESSSLGRIALGTQASHRSHTDSTFEAHYSIGDLAKQWRLGRETVRLLFKDEPGVVKVRMGLRKAITRYSVPESVARRVHTGLFHPMA